MADPNVFVAAIGTRGFGNPGVNSSPTVPTHLPGDILVLACSGVGNAGFSVPAGWTDPSIVATSDGSDTADGSSSTVIYYKRVTDMNEVTSPLTVTAPTNGAHLSQITVVRGAVLTGSPFHDTGITSDNTADTDQTLAALTSTLDQTTVLYVASFGENSFYTDTWANADLDQTAITELDDQNVNGTTDHTFSHAWGATTETAIAAATVSHTASGKESGVALAFDPDTTEAPRIVGISAQGTNTVAAPDHYQDGDLLVILAAGRTNPDGADPTPSGWTLDQYISTGAFGVLQATAHVFTKTASGAQGSVVLTIDDAPLTRMIAIRTSDGLTTPAVNDIGASFDASADTDVTDDFPNDVVTTIANALVLHYSTLSDNTAMSVALGSSTLANEGFMYENSTSAGSDSLASLVIGLKAAAGTLPVPDAGTSGGSEVGVGVTIGITQAQAGGSGGGGASLSASGGPLAGPGQLLRTGA